MATSAPARAVRFGVFEVDLRAGELRKSGVRVKLHEQPFQVLTMLLEHPGELVTREEFRNRLWPGDTFVDFDHGLNNAVNRLRDALGDSAENPKYIETLPRRGYRFLLPVSNGRQEVTSGASQQDQPADLTHSPGATAPQPYLYRYAPYAFVTLLIAALVIVFYFREPATPKSSRLFVLPPDGTTFNLITDDGGSVVLSPDGTKLAFVATAANGPARIWIRQLSRLSSDLLENTAGATFPFWSPDSQWIGFFADGKLKKVRVAGGASVILCDAPFGRGGSWSNGVIIFAPASHTGIFKIPDSGGSPVQLTLVDAALHTTHRWPKFLPDGRHFLYLAASHFRDAAHDGIYLGSVDGREQRLIVASQSDATYASGFLFFYGKSKLLMVKFNPQTAQLQGEPRPTGEQVLYDGSIWKAIFDASDTGVMAYQLGERVGGSQLHWFDRSGRELERVGEPAFQTEGRLSPDGQKLAIGIGEAGYSNLWVYDFARHARMQVTFSPFDHGSPVWYAGGKQLIFASKRKYYVLARMDASASRSEEIILDTGLDSWPLDISPDGRFLLYGKGLAIGIAKSQLWIYPLAGTQAPFRLLEGDSIETEGQFSPDGRWIAYASNESGRKEVYLVPFRDRSASLSGALVRERLQVSVAGGHAPRWRRDGKELFYLAADKMLNSVQVLSAGSQLHLGPARPLFHINPNLAGSYSYDVSPDAKRFIVNTAPEEKTAPITLVQNWQSDFK